jgi:hypothetical protein
MPYLLLDLAVFLVFLSLPLCRIAILLLPTICSSSAAGVEMAY